VSSQHVARDGAATAVSRPGGCPPDSDYRFVNAPRPSFNEGGSARRGENRGFRERAREVTSTKVISNTTGAKALAVIAERKITAAKFAAPVRNCVGGRSSSHTEERSDRQYIRKLDNPRRDHYCRRPSRSYNFSPNKQERRRNHSRLAGVHARRTRAILVLLSLQWVHRKEGIMKKTSMLFAFAVIAAMSLPLTAIAQQAQWQGTTTPPMLVPSPSNTKVGIGVSSASYPFDFRWTLPTGANTYAMYLDITSTGSANVIQQAAEVILREGYTGSSSTAALGFRNYAAGVGNSIDIATYGNYGVYGITTGTTVGDNGGVVGYAVGGNHNFGLIANTMQAKTGAKNVAVLGYSYNNAADVAIGGYFALSAGSQKPHFTSAALIADNADLAATAPIFIGRSGNVDKFTIDKSGNVTVNGNISATGTIVGAVYQDVAEWVPATTKMAPGTVVVLNPEHKNEVKPSETAYDTRVAGVVSANPGLLLGKGGDSQAMIATTGRVQVHVDATKRPIHIGDLLVTSDQSGTAMVSEPLEIAGRKIHQPGTVIGKALEPLDSGRGDILVLLSLQ
jgi:hypothetical protein